MAKTTDKRPAKMKSPNVYDKSLVKVDSKAFDPSLASLFASSVSLSAYEVGCLC